MSFLIPNELAKPGRKLAKQQILIAVVVVITCTLLTCFFWELAYAQSVLTGGVIAIIPNMIFAYKAFKYAGATSAKKIMDSFFSGVKIKMVITAILFALAFKFLVIVPIPFFSMYCLVMVLPLLIPVFFKL